MPARSVRSAPRLPVHCRVTLLARRPVLQTGEMGSIPIRDAIPRYPADPALGLRTREGVFDSRIAVHDGPALVGYEHAPSKRVVGVRLPGGSPARFRGAMDAHPTPNREAESSNLSGTANRASSPMAEASVSKADQSRFESEGAHHSRILGLLVGHRPFKPGRPVRSRQDAPRSRRVRIVGVRRLRNALAEVRSLYLAPLVGDVRCQPLRVPSGDAEDRCGR
jgi:hypothetical protein